MEIPVLRNLEQTELKLYFTHLEYSISYFQRNVIYKVADYVVLPIFMTKQTPETQQFVETGNLTSYVILFCVTNGKAFVSCSPTSEDCWEEEKLRRFLTTRINSPLGQWSLGTIYSTTYNHASSIIWRTFTGSVELNDLCSYTRPKLSARRILLNSEFCTKLLISQSVYCTSTSCTRILLGYYKFQRVHLSQNQNSYLYHYSPYGSHVHGFRYSVFLVRKVLHRII